jgi:hypothetical protein
LRQAAREGEADILDAANELFQLDQGRPSEAPTRAAVEAATKPR